MSQLKNILQYKYIGRFIYISIFITLVLLTIINYYLVLILIIYIIWFYKIFKDIFVFTIVVSFVVGLLYIYKDNYSVKINLDTKEITCKVIDINNKNNFICNYQHEKVIIYYEDTSYIKPGDLITIYGEFYYPQENLLPNTFNYQKYLKSRGIYIGFYASDIKFNDRYFNPNIIKYKILEYLDEKYTSKSSAYLKTFLIGYKYELENELLNSLNSLGISHLFVISGMHVGIMVYIIETFLKRFFTRERIKIIICLFLLIYIVITGYTPSVIRASMMYIMIIFNKKFNLSLSTLDIISSIYIILLIINPLNINNISFILTFLISYCLIIGRKIILSDNKIISIFKVFFFIQVVTLPIMCYLNYQINLLTIVYNIFLIPYVLFIFLPLTYIVLIFRFTEIGYIYIINKFEEIISMFSEYDFFYFELGFNNIIFIIIYYLIVFIVFRNIEQNELKKNILILLILIIFIKYQRIFMIHDEVRVLNVGQGDSILILGKYDTCNMLIDTGRKDEYDNLIRYLKNNNINHLDYIVITHSHDDHAGELFDLLDKLNVNKVIVSEYDYYEDKSFSYLKSGDVIKCGNLTFDVLGPIKDNENLNNISLVLYSEIGSDKWLFTGDCEFEEEIDIIDKYQLSIDVLKVGHHGSDTSTSDELLKIYQPKIAVISLGSDNIYGFPDDELIKRLRKYNVNIYQTNIHGVVSFKYYFRFKRIIN